MLELRQVVILLIAELWFCTLKVECDGNFTQCYNTASETHCFSKIVNGPVNFSDAQNRCNAIDATIPVIKDGEVQQLLEKFISNIYQSGGIEDSISYFWINAYRVVGTRWQWLNSSVINELSANVTTGFSLDVHVASIGSGQQDVRLVANNPGEIFSYICEYFGNDCQRQDGRVLQSGDKCYVAYKENGTWYDARNRCLQERGDLASFGDLKSTNINFTQWLDLSNGKQYWVGARIIWWSWKTSDNAEARYTSWFRHYPITLYNTDECLTVWATSLLSGWKTDDCNKVLNVGAICQKVTSLGSSKSTTVSSLTSSTAPIVASITSSKASTVLPLSFEPSKSTSTMASFASPTAPTVSSLASPTAPTVLPISFEPPKSTTTVPSFDSSKSTTAAPFDSSKSTTAAPFDSSMSTTAAPFDSSMSTTAVPFDSSMSTTVASFDSSKSTPAAAFDSSADTTTSNNCSSCAASTVESLESSAGTSRAIRLGVGIGLGLGIPIVIVLIIIIVVCVRQKRKPRSSGNNYAVSSHDHVLHDAHSPSLETDKNDVETGEIYSEVAKNDDDQVVESNANNIEYSAVEFVDGGNDQEDLP